MKNKFLWVVLAFMAVTVSCARVQVEAPKDPIKMDITMRLDVYQHVAKDIDDIEKIVSGADTQPTLANVLVPSAHAADLSPEVEQAAYRRRDRLAELSSLKSQRTIAESPSALLTLKDSGNSRAKKLVNEENDDRMIIYRALAAKNETSVEQVQKIYADKLK